jgi:hypothetical protein
MAAANRAQPIAGVKPVAARLVPPLKPTTNSRYREQNLAAAAGISRFDRKAPASIPKKNSRIAGSMRLAKREVFIRIHF